jgi:hypothetical protein
MRFHNLTLDREERVTPTFAIPGGRLLTAELHVPAIVFTFSPDSVDDTLQLVVEVRAHPDGEFEQVAATAVMLQTAENIAKVEVPTPKEPVPAGVHPPVGRLRLIHTGTMQPRYEINLVGL